MKTKSLNIRRENHSITPSERRTRNGHNPGIIDFVAEIEHQKTVLISKLEGQLMNAGFQIGIISNTKIRQALSRDLSHSPLDTKENLRRANEMANLMAEAGWLVLADFQSCASPQIKAPYIHTHNNLHLVTFTIKDSNQNHNSPEIRKFSNFSNVTLSAESVSLPKTIDCLVKFISTKFFLNIIP